MTAFAQAKMAYSLGAAPLRSPRRTEYDVFSSITARLIAAQSQGKAGFSALAVALDDNRKLWTVLATDLADDANALPLPLRARLLSLADFSLQHTSRVLLGDASADDLVEINRAVMRGLQSEGVAA